LATIREWRNSFVPINRAPSEVLSLIPTHLSDEKDLLSVSAVCRHWRRTFIHHAALWSRLNLTTKRSVHFVKMLLERAKGSALDVRFPCVGCTDILALLSPHAQQFRTLDFTLDHWSSIRRFSEVVFGPLPLLRTLKINAMGTTNPPSLPLFSGAVNLKNFFLYSEGAPFLNHFTFPNLTTFEFSAVYEEFPISQLLNFLEALPTLQTVRIRIKEEILLDVPPERVIILPNVEVFSVTQGEPGYRIVPHISCPSARRISLIREQDVEAEVPQEIFPAWNTISPQYTASAIDKIAFGITTIGEDLVSFSLSFISPGSVTLELGYKIIMGDEDYDESMPELGWKYNQVFKHAFEAIRTHPLLNNVKRLHIWDRHRLFNPHQLVSMAMEVTGLFRFVGPLEELVLDIDDLRLFLSPFLDFPELRVSMEQGVFPLVKGLIIAEHLKDPFDEQCVVAIVRFVKSQHMRGVPFERVVFHVRYPPAGMAERLEPWVSIVDFSEDMISADDQDSV